MLAGSRDKNEPEIVAALEACGCLVASVTAKDIPDLIVWSPFLQSIVLLEVKDGARVVSGRKLRPGQVEFHAKWSAAGAPVHKVINVFQALKAVGTKPTRGRKAPP